MSMIFVSDSGGSCRSSHISGKRIASRRKKTPRTARKLRGVDRFFERIGDPSSLKRGGHAPRWWRLFLAVADPAPHPALLTTHLTAALSTAATGHTFSWALAISCKTRPTESRICWECPRSFGKAPSIPRPGKILKGRNRLPRKIAKWIWSGGAEPR
jgi:hypothetical protein